MSETEIKKVKICGRCGHTRFAHNNAGDECASCRGKCVFVEGEEIETTDVRALVAERDYITRKLYFWYVAGCLRSGKQKFALIDGRIREFDVMTDTDIAPNQWYVLLGTGKYLGERWSIDTIYEANKNKPDFDTKPYETFFENEKKTIKVLAELLETSNVRLQQESEDF